MLSLSVCSHSDACLRASSLRPYPYISKGRFCGEKIISVCQRAMLCPMMRLRFCSHSDACLRASSLWPAISSCCIWPAACCRSPKPGRGCSTSDDTPWAEPPNPADPPDQGSFEGGAAAVRWVCAGAKSAARRASANKSQSNPATAE